MNSNFDPTNLQKDLPYLSFVISIGSVGPRMTHPIMDSVRVTNLETDDFGDQSNRTIYVREFPTCQINPLRLLDQDRRYCTGRIIAFPSYIRFSVKSATVCKTLLSIEIGTRNYMTIQMVMASSRTHRCTCYAASPDTAYFRER
jgi:hypothetical protein